MSKAKEFSVDEMWRVSQRNNAAWGIEGYDVPRKYLDAREINRNKKLAALDPGKYIKAPEVYFCEKGHYLDFQTKAQTVQATHGENGKVTKRKYRPGPGSYLKT